MALVKFETENAASSEADTTETVRAEQRKYSRDQDGLQQALLDEDVVTRRWAARDLAEFSGSVDALVQRLEFEKDCAVVEAIFDSLFQIADANVVEALVPLLRSEVTCLRNGAIEVLQSLPDHVAPYMQALLKDPDSDVRIFAIDILQVLAHQQAPLWLVDVVNEDDHVNVVASAIDRLVEIGDGSMVPALDAVRRRFAGEPFIAFAVDTAIRRISDN